jgi:hypothetical protein
VGGIGGNNILTRYQEKLFPLWPYIYYCLISGDWEIAIDELKVCIANGVPNVEADIVIVLQYYQYFISKYNQLANRTSVVDESVLTELLEGGKSSSGTGGGGDKNQNILTREQLKEMYQAMENCKELYERETVNLTDQSSGDNTGGSGSSSSDPYRQLILNLVSLSDKTALSDPGLATLTYSLQTYLWANLWFMVFERYALVAINGPQGLVAAGTGAAGTGQDKPVEMG